MRKSETSWDGTSDNDIIIRLGISFCRGHSEYFLLSGHRMFVLTRTSRMNGVCVWGGGEWRGFGAWCVNRKFSWQLFYVWKCHLTCRLACQLTCDTCRCILTRRAYAGYVYTDCYDVITLLAPTNQLLHARKKQESGVDRLHIPFSSVVTASLDR